MAPHRAKPFRRPNRAHPDDRTKPSAPAPRLHHAKKLDRPWHDVAVPSQSRIIHGDDLLYRFFQEAFENEDALESGLTQQLLGSMAIWLPVDLYAAWPILLPWVVRDPSCRGNKRMGMPDSWSSPDAAGFLRDDNSLVKALPRALTIRGSRDSRLANVRMGSEFVAAHIWRQTRLPGPLASRLPELNSFVPNIVWLPRQIAKLTDREGSLIQQALQAMAVQVYRHAPVNQAVRGHAERSWDLLPEPAITVRPVEAASLNWFIPTAGFYRTREKRLRTVIRALMLLEEGLPLDEKVVTTRYTRGLPLVEAEARRRLLRQLTSFYPG